VLRGPQISVKPSLKKCGYGPILQYCCSVAALHGRWNRGSRGSSCSPNFWHGRAGHSSCSPKSLSLLHCDVRLSRIDLDILEFCHSVERSRTKKLSASGGLRPLTPYQGLCPWTPLGAPPPGPRYRLAVHALAMAPATACSPNFQTLPTPMFSDV